MLTCHTVNLYTSYVGMYSYHKECKLCGLHLVCPVLTGSSGNGMYMSWSRRPGLKMAGSMMSGLLVAPMMNTFFLELMPSISVRI